MKNLFISIKTLFGISKIYVFLNLYSSFFASIIQIVLVYSIKLVIDLLEIKNTNLLLNILVVVFCISIFLPLFNSFFSNRTIPIINNRIDKYLIEKIYKKYLDIDLNYFFLTSNYDLYYYALENVIVIKEMLGLLSNLLTSILSVLGITALFIFFDYKLVIIIFSGVFITSLMSLFREKICFELEIENIPLVRKIDYINRIFYILDYSKEIRNNNGYKFFEKLTNSYESINNNIKKYSKKLILIDFFEEFIKINTFVIILYILINKKLDGAITIGAFSMIIAGCQEVYSLLENIFKNLPLLYSMSLKIEKIKEFMNTGLISYKNLYFKDIDNIEIENMYFSYGNSNDFILENISIKIENNDKKIAIIGDNGSGKSTLLNIISGIYRLRKGELRINGFLINENINLSNYREFFYIVFQDFKFFPMTIKENFLLLMKNCSMSYEENIELEKKIFESLKLVGMYEKVMSLKKGIHTVISREFCDSGENFSQGELQRLSIAKAHFSDCKILILDEPFSFCDKDLKDNIKNIIEKLSNEKIVLIVTHDVVDFSLFDKVYEIKNKTSTLLYEKN